MTEQRIQSIPAETSQERSDLERSALERRAEMFKALSNPHRLNIFIQLTQCCVPGTRLEGRDEERACVGDLGRQLNIAPSTVSHHIKELVRAGLIRNQRRGQTIECWVDPVVLNELSAFFDLSTGGGCSPTGTACTIESQGDESP